MKKFLALMALLICFTMLFVACNEEATEAPTEEPTEPVVEVCTHAYDNDCDASCNLCGEKRETTHTEVAIPAKAATCTATGLTAGTKCSVCNVIIKAPEVVAPIAHTIVEFGETKAPTCTETGLAKGQKCSVCDYELEPQKVVAATGHTEEVIPGEDATCTTDGKTPGKKCSVCGVVTLAQKVVEGGHAWTVIPAKDATCTQKGNEEGKECAVCGLVEIKYTDMLAHTVVEFDEVPATCTQAGYTDGTKCSVCDTVITGVEVAPALGHTEVDVPAVAPTCTETGLNAGKQCEVCNVFTVPQTVIPALKHPAEAQKPLADKAPTCDSIGFVGGIECTLCNTTIVAPTIVPAKHSPASICSPYCAICEYPVDHEDHAYSSDCDRTCNNEGCTVTRYSAVDHAQENNCHECDNCGAALPTKHTTFSHGHCVRCGDVDPAFAGVEGVITYQQAWEYSAENGDYYLDGMDVNSISSSYSHDGYNIRANNWQITGFIKDNPAANGYMYTDQPIKIDASSNAPYVNMCGWVYFGSIGGELALADFGLFVDSITSTDDIVTNADTITPGHLEIFNGTGAGLNATGGVHIGVQGAVGENCRVYCVTPFNTGSALWNTLRTQPGEHTFYICAKMKDGTWIVVKDVAIEVVAEHEHVFPTTKTDDAATMSNVVAPTCTTDGYTEVGCISGVTNCAARGKIDIIPATGHNPESTWTYANGMHYHKCQNAGCHLDEAACYGADGEKCDTCGGLYNCKHVISKPNATTGVLTCTKCASTWAPNTYVEGSTFKTVTPDAFQALFCIGSHEVITENGETFLRSSGAGTAAGAVTWSVIQNPNQYVVIRYRANENTSAYFCHFNQNSPNGQQHTEIKNLGTDGKWTIAVLDLTCAGIAGRLDIRWNIGGSANAQTDVTHIATFVSATDAQIYAEMLGYAGCEHANKTEIAGKDASCFEDGYTASTVCADCGYVIVASETVAQYGEHIDAVEDGLCDRCGIDMIENCEHNGTVVDVEAKDPTCEEAGTTAGKICTYCKKYVEGNAIDPLGHTLGEAATCTTAQICTVEGCGQVIVEALGHDYEGDCDATCGVCDYVRETAADHDTENVCDDDCGVCGVTGLAIHDNGFLHGVCSIEGCGATDPAYAGVEGVMSYTEAWNYSADNGDYYIDGTDADNIGSSYSEDGYTYHPSAWTMTADVVTNPAGNGKKYPTDGTPIRIDANSTQPFLNMCGWIYFGSIGGQCALDNFAIFADKITDKSEIIDNSESDSPGYIEIWNGVGAGATNGGDVAHSADVMAAIGQNCRRYCVTIFNTNNTLWGELKDEPGIHKLYITAKMKDGTYVVIKSVKIEVVESHEHKYETAASNATCMPSKIVNATCTTGGYTEIGCIGVDVGCTTMKKINEVTALGHKASAEWTALDGQHWNVCENGCGEKQNEGTCVDNNSDAKCDTCGNVLACDHVYSLNETTGVITCTGDCGGVLASPHAYLAGDAFWTSVSVANNQFCAGLTPTWNSGEKYVGVQGAGANDASTSVLSIKYGPVYGNSTDTLGRYVLMRYRTGNAGNGMNMVFATYGSPATSAVLPYGSDSGWTNQVFDMGADGSVGQRVDIRINIGGSASSKTHIEKFVAFNSKEDADAYKIALDHVYNGHTFTMADNGTLTCACGKTSVTPATYKTPAVFGSGAFVGGAPTAVPTNAEGAVWSSVAAQTQYQYVDGTMQRYLVVRVKSDKNTKIGLSYYNTATHSSQFSINSITGGAWTVLVVDMNCVPADTHSLFGFSPDWDGVGATVTVSGAFTFNNADDANDYAELLRTMG